jgi:hypothetical protein
MHALTWDVGIVAATGLLLAFSLLIRRHKALATLVSVYIAYFVASSWGDKISSLLTGNQTIFHQVWIKTNASPAVVQAVLLVIFTLLISMFIKLGGRRARYSSLEVVVYSVCTVAVTTMFILLFLPQSTRDDVLAGSKIVPFIYQWRDWILMVPVIAIIYFGIYGDDDL